MEANNDSTKSFVPLTAGTRVAHYEIISKIGAGGMGEVYLAEDSQLDRRVALKFLSFHLSQDETSRARFTREAKAAAKLDHPNIVPVHEVGEYQGRPFFAMAYIEGQSLREVIKRGKLTVSGAIGHCMQICEGLHKAHQSGVVHRDIKPGNIIIDKEQRARILDFGLATLSGEEKLTKTGSTLGTVGYMSPEQITGKDVDHRSDIFSIGVILYEMLTGRRPFEGDNDAAVVKAITDVNPEPVSRYKSGVSGELQQVVDKALSKDPTLRYQHADGMLSDLKRLKTEPVPTPPSRIALWIAAAVVVLAAVAALYSFWPKGAPVKEDVIIMLAVLPFENLGSAEDEYFADGITDEITSRLAKVSGLGVISRTSAMKYKKSEKSLPEIGQELAVDYILEGTIRWDRSGDTDFVRITPQLIRVADDRHMWAESYERQLTRIFTVQADIASKIISEIGITLMQSERAALQTIPTDNMEAYQAYLRGLDHYRNPDFSNAHFRTAVRMFERAVSLDSNFALAYAQLSRSRSVLYHNGGDRSEENLKKAKSAVERALDLNPNLPEARLALGQFYYRCFRDYDRALEQYELAKQSLLNDANLYMALATIHKRQGRFETAIEYLGKLIVLNPLSPLAHQEVAICLAYMGRWEEADSYLKRSIAIAPDQRTRYADRAFFRVLWDGDIAAARAILETAPTVEAAVWIWLLTLERSYDSAISYARSLPDMTRDQSWVSPRTLTIGKLYYLKGDSSRAKVSFDSALSFIEKELSDYPDDFRLHSAQGIILAHLNRADEAVREGKLAVESFPVTKDVLGGLPPIRDLAYIYLITGDYPAAINELDFLLSRFEYTSNFLRVHPDWDPLRDQPRFHALLEKYDTGK